MTALLTRGARQLPGAGSARTPAAFVSVLGTADPAVTPLLGPADSKTATPVMGASRVTASSSVTGPADPAAVPVLGPADSLAAVPVMSDLR